MVSFAVGPRWPGATRTGFVVRKAANMGTSPCAGAKLLIAAAAATVGISLAAAPAAARPSDPHDPGWGGFPAQDVSAMHGYHALASTVRHIETDFIRGARHLLPPHEKFSPRGSGH